MQQWLKQKDVDLTDLIKGLKLSQAEFARIIGVDRAVVCRLLEKEILAPEGTGREWLLQYIAHLKGAAAGRSARGFFG
jgi:DNA-binding transcriptional regulator YiaG